eukprot:TRINITY_DN32674_c0_g1_i1.p1 TRINITY_DN32674_c0_g1~~TRINITY_DN32674_c0_g1_i1.p1  ORF type:complete len:536 (+),score=151.25 TRINITY_DN32674_c0_g1_i1:62-1669(+)
MALKRVRDVAELADVVPVAGRRRLAFGEEGRQRLKASLDSHPKEKVLIALEQWAQQHGVVDVPLSDGKAVDAEFRGVIDGGLDMLRAMGVSRHAFHETLLKRLSGSLVALFVGLSAQEPPTEMVALLHWLADACEHPVIEELFMRGIGAVLRIPSRTPGILSERTLEALFSKPLTTLPYPTVRGRLWVHSADRFFADVAAVRGALKADDTLADLFTYEYQMEGLMTYAQRLGCSAPPFFDPDHPPAALVATTQPVTAALADQAALHVRLQEYAEADPDPEFYFALCFSEWSLLRLLVELTDSLVTLTNTGFYTLPPRVLNLSTATIDDAFRPQYQGAHYTEALRLPYIASGLHLVLLHTAHSGAANARPLTSGLFRLVCRVHDEDSSEAVFAQLVKGAAEGALPGDLRTEGAVLLNLALYMVFGLLASMPASVDLCHSLLRYVHREIKEQAVYRESVQYALSLVVTALGRALRQERTGMLALADLLAQYVLLPFARDGYAFPDLAEFLIESCDCTDGSLPRHLQELSDYDDAAPP